MIFSFSSSSVQPYRLGRNSSTFRIFSLLLLTTGIRVGTAFQVLPYVHIDYEHYYRLAQCQAQCTEKYGHVAYKRRLDGSTRAFFDTSTFPHYNLCQLGCQNARVTSAPAVKTRTAVDDNAFRDGQKFWLNSDTQASSGKKSTLLSMQTAEKSPVTALGIVCLKPSSSVEVVAPSSSTADNFFDSYQAILSAQPYKTDFLAPVRYLLQWKQRIPLSSANSNKKLSIRFDETKWITASIESDSTFTAESLQPGVQYRFMVTVIGSAGRLGSTVSSDWIETPLLGTPMSTIPLPLVITPQFNSDDNVSAVVSFRRESNSNRRMSIATTCSFHLHFTNKSRQIYTVDFEMDESEGLLLTNLAFNTQYEVEVQPRNSAAIALNTSNHINTNKGATSTARFRTIACPDVFGGGSLECEPEPVRDLDIRLNEENATVQLSWRASTEVRYVLLYELRYVPLSVRGECPLDEATMYLPAKATSAELALPTGFHCEIELYLTNFDLRGREASITARFVYAPKTSAVDSNASFYSFNSLPSNIWIVVAAPVLVIFALLLVVFRLAATNQRRLKKKMGGLVGVTEAGAKVSLRPKSGADGLPSPVNV